MIDIQKSDDPQTRLFVFSGKKSTFPLKPEEEAIFYGTKVIEKYPQENLPSSEDAHKTGYYVASTLLRNTIVNDVTLSVSETGNDIVAITLVSTASWTKAIESQKSTAFTLGNRTSTPQQSTQEKTLENSVHAMLMRLVEDQTPLYKTPSEKNPATFLKTVNDYLHSSKTGKAYEQVFTVIEDHNKNTNAVPVEAIKWDDDRKQLHLVFAGVCKTKCVGSMNTTQMLLDSALRRRFPEIRSTVF